VDVVAGDAPGAHFLTLPHQQLFFTAQKRYNCTLQAIYLRKTISSYRTFSP
jgi:hypothetical protein